MLTNSVKGNVKTLTDLVESFFGENVTAFYIVPNENDEGFYLTCLLYRSFQVIFSLGDVARGGVFGIKIYLGDKPYSLEILAGPNPDLPFGFNENSINANLEALDEYLQWRMTDAQKATFGLL